MQVVNVPILTELTPQEVVLIKILKGLGIFDIRSGSVTINFDGNGQITSVDKKEHFKI